MSILRREHEPLVPGGDETPGRPYQAAQRAAAYDTLLALHEYLLPERYGKKHANGSKKSRVALQHVLDVVDEAVYYHPGSRYPEG